MTATAPIVRPERADGLAAFLARLTRRSVLDAAEIEAILSLPTTQHHVRANHDIVRLGEVVDHTCLIIDGLVGRFGQTSAGERQIIALHIPGDMADLHSAVMPRVTAPLQALTACTVTHVPHEAIRDVANRFPTIAQALWRDCMVDFAVMSQWLLSIGRRPAKARLAHLICEMSLRYEQIGAKTSEGFVFPATQHHIGDALGLTPVHVNRMFRALKQEGLIDISGRVITIRDSEGLAAISEFDRGYLQLEAIDLHKR